MPDFSFKKGERLSSKKTISSLFQTGESVVSYPLRIIYNHAETGPYPVCVAVSVPKRLFKRAVDRNLLKRRIRESYRLNKSQFYGRLRKRKIHLNMVIQYQQGNLNDFQTIQTGLIKAMDKLMDQLNV